MQQTTNYKLNKPELTDLPDITQLNQNFDTVDATLKNLETVKAPLNSPTFTGTVTGAFKGNLNGNASSATKLSVSAGDSNTPVYFDGGKPKACTGLDLNTASADKLSSAKTIAISGAVTGTATGFDGSKNITIPTTAVDGSKVTGTVPAATKATQDSSGNVIGQTYLKLSGGTMTNSITWASSLMAKRDKDDSALTIYGATAYESGASLSLSGKDREGFEGQATLTARNDDASAALTLSPSGEAKIDGNDIITSLGGILSGNLTFSNEESTVKRTDNAGYITMNGGTGYSNGGVVTVYGKDSDSTYSGGVLLHAQNDTGAGNVFLSPTGEFKVGSKHIVRSVNGVSANAAGNVDAVASMMPDYSAGVTISTSQTASNYTPPANGVIIGVKTENGNDQEWFIKSGSVFLAHKFGGYYGNGFSCCVSVQKGKTYSIKGANVASFTFYPFMGG